jgi:hypothetical protein
MLTVQLGRSKNWYLEELSQSYDNGAQKELFLKCYFYRLAHLQGKEQSLSHSMLTRLTWTTT